MKIKNKVLTQEVIASIQAFVDKDINVTAAFKLARVIKKLSTILEEKDSAEKKLIDKYAERDSEGNYTPAKDAEGVERAGMVNITDPENFGKDMNELGEIESDIDYEPLEMESIGLEKISTREMINLEFLFA